jgi:hypothetical protein
MNQIILATLLCVTITLAEAKPPPLVNTEAGTFRCLGSVVRLAPGGFPVSGEPGGDMKPCNPIVEVKDTI